MLNTKYSLFEEFVLYVCQQLIGFRGSKFSSKFSEPLGLVIRFVFIHHTEDACVSIVSCTRFVRQHLGHQLMWVNV